MNDKLEIREKILKTRMAMPVEEVNDKSSLIARKVCELMQYRRAESVFIYMAYRNEVKTDTIIRNARRSGKKVFHPAILDEECRMVAAMPQDEGAFILNQYGIFEPDIYSSIIYSPEQLDVAIIPGIAFDTHCARMGYGKGYYDRYLCNAPNIYKIGLAYENQILDAIPCTQYDIHMDAVVTEDRIILHS